ncbi:MAG: helix-turn-helix transcriptional regulator [Lachnospiraceae bacterium]|nr:helix-turn-helix transcriptional regulator [Lachnospiraceae bacterium]
MFDMREIGKRIARFRKEKGMTQMGLANQLGVSYQAVSNWERGESMPDIAKLEDLSKVLGASIDEILGNDKKSKAAETLSRGEIPEDIKEVLPELLPVMEPEQIEQSVKTLEEDTLDVAYLISIAPFVEKETISALALKLEGEADPAELIGLAPFLENGVLDKLIGSVTGPMDLPYLIAIAPFVEKETISALALKLEGEVDPALLCGLAPFLEHGVLDQMIRKCVSRPLNHAEQMSLFPFLSRESLAQLLKSYLKKQL